MSKGNYEECQKAADRRQMRQLKGKMQYLCRSAHGHHPHTLHMILQQKAALWDIERQCIEGR